MNARAETTVGKAAPRDKREKISENVAEDHARLLGMLGQCLAEVGVKAALTTFHNLVLYGETFALPSRYEPELDVFWSGERSGTAFRVRLIERSGNTFYAWGMSWAKTHPATDLAGAVRVVADAVRAA
jgi:hypothetical protein